MNLLKLVVVVHILGLFVCNLLGLFTRAWEQIYFYWDKSAGAGFLVWMVLYYAVSRDRKWIIRPVLILAVIRFIWQVIAYMKGWDINNEAWLALFFVLLSAGAGYLVLHEKSRANVWLSKHLNI